MQRMQRQRCRAAHILYDVMMTKASAPDAHIRPEPAPMPLAGLRVLELGQLIAGPFACSLLAGFGAEVIKIEPPGEGDPLRHWRKVYRGTSLWWRVMGRNKQSVALDLHDPRGQELVRRMIARGAIDIVVENFRPGRLEAWGLGWEVLHALDPRLILVRVSGWGQDGPRAAEPGFANVAEAAAGLRYLTGEPGHPPVRSGVSLGDTLAGLHAALGALTAAYHRDAAGGGEGQVVDVALSESIFNMLESLLPEYDLLGHVRERGGAKLEGIAPSGTYPCAGEDEYVVIGANSDSMFRRLMNALGRPELAADPRLAHNDGRVVHEAEIDAAISAWTGARAKHEALAALRAAEVACGPIQSIADIVDDAQFLARGMFERVRLPDGQPVRIPAVVPRLARTPGQTRWIGPELGSHTLAVLRDLAGATEAELQALADSGVIATAPLAGPDAASPPSH
jgi:formyl-CoA transferase